MTEGSRSTVTWKAGAVARLHSAGVEDEGHAALADQLLIQAPDLRLHQLHED